MKKTCILVFAALSCFLGAGLPVRQDITVYFFRFEDRLGGATVLVDLRTFDIEANSLEVRASFKRQTISDRIEGRFRTFGCLYRNEEALSPDRKRSFRLRLISCGGGWEGPDSFQQLEYVTVSVKDAGRSHRMSCREVTEERLVDPDPGEALAFDCWIAIRR